jgi:hypothetical protein
MFGRSHVRSRVAALTVAAGLAVSGTFVALTPSVAGAAGPNPLGPTVAQLQASYATTLANAEGELPAVENVYGLASREAGFMVDQPGCLVLAVTNLLGVTHTFPNYDCIIAGL